MAQNPKQSYSFSFFTALWITLFAVILVAVVEHLFLHIFWWSLLVFGPVFFLFAYLLIQIRVEQYVYKGIKKVYKNVSLLASSSIEEEQVTTDMDALQENVEKFAEKKKLEIEALKIRENYRKEFVGNISHELKTPLFTVQAYILTLLEGAKDDQKRCETYLQRAEKAVDRLIYIVDDLDMISKLEAGELHLDIDRFNIVDTLKIVFDMLDMQATDKKISLTLDRPYKKPIWVCADRERIQQVLTNLVVNSIKYGKKQGTTEVSIDDLSDDKVIVRITDNGQGFKKEDTARLFERFFRLDKSGSRNHGGSGLGLSIVKHIVEAHHQKIFVDTDYGVGSEFSFTLDKAKADHPTSDE